MGQQYHTGKWAPLADKAATCVCVFVCVPQGHAQERPDVSPLAHAQNRPVSYIYVTYISTRTSTK